jgi:hypothetical protein
MPENPGNICNRVTETNQERGARVAKIVDCDSLKSKLLNGGREPVLSEPTVVECITLESRVKTQRILSCEVQGF